MDRFLQEVRYAARGLARSPGFAAVAVLTLALGIGANTAVFSLVNEVLLRPLPVAQPEEVVRVYTSDFSSGPFGSTSYPDYLDFKEKSGSLQSLAAYSFTFSVNFSDGEQAERLPSALASGNYFSTLGIQPALGRLLLPEDDRAKGAHPVAVISFGTWQKRFGGEKDILGRRITVNGRPFEVVGVAPEKFAGVEVGTYPELWLPIQMCEQAIPRLAGRDPSILESRGSRWLDMVGRLEGGASLDAAEAELNALMAALADEFPRTNLGTLQEPEEPRPMTVLPAHEAALGGDARTGADRRAFLLMAIVGLVLLVACANVANLMLARYQKKQRQVSLRLALGAGRGRIALQTLSESALLGLLGGGAGIALAWAMVKALLPLGLPTALQGSLELREVSLDSTVLLFALALSLATGLIFGLAPAGQSMRMDLVSSLKGSESESGGPSRRYGMRDLLAALQIAASLVLLAAAGLFIRGAVDAYRTPLGFNPEGVAVASLDAGRQGMNEAQGLNFFEQVRERVEALPSVASASLSAVVPVQAAGSRRSYRIEGYEPKQGEDMEINMNWVTPGYFETLRIPIVMGRPLGEGDGPQARRVAVVNRAFAEKYWPGMNPVGRRIGNSDELHTEIVGVAADSKYRSVREDSMPYLYLPLAQDYRSSAVLAARTSGDPASLTGRIREVVRSLEPTMPVFNARTLEGHLGLALAQERNTALMIASLGLLALLVASIGIYGVVSYTVSQRTREMGIRAALGARAHEILGLVLGRSLKLAAGGIAVGLAAALAVGRSLAGFVEGASASEPLSLAAVAALLAAVALASSYAPARRAARVHPMEALRYE